MALLKSVRDLLLSRRAPIDYARAQGVKVGENCRFIGIQRGTFGSEPYLVTIGNHVTVTSRVLFITHEGGAWIFREEFPQIDAFAPIVVEDNCFIGIGAIILPGVTIGANSVVGAGAVVTKNVPPGSIVGGVPARVLATSEEFKARLLERAVFIRDLQGEEKRAAVLAAMGR